MKIIVAGGRDYTNKDIVFKALDNMSKSINITEVVCGMAKGVDTLGREWAIKNDIPVAEFPADWNKHGKAAGPIRNKEMRDYAQGLVAFWDGQSRGTKNMIDLSVGNLLIVTVFKV